MEESLYHRLQNNMNSCPILICFRKIYYEALLRIRKVYKIILKWLETCISSQLIMASEFSINTVLHQRLQLSSDLFPLVLITLKLI